MQHHESMKLVSKITAAGFVLSFLLNCAAPFFPVDMSQNPPYYPKIVLIIQSLAVALVIFSSTLLGLKLTEEKEDIGGSRVHHVCDNQWYQPRDFF